MYFKQIFILCLLMMYLHNKSLKNLTYDNFIVIILFTWIFIYELPYNKKEYLAAGVTSGALLDNEEWENLSKIIRNLMNNDTIEIPCNLEIKGDLDCKGAIKTNHLELPLGLNTSKINQLDPDGTGIYISANKVDIDSPADFKNNVNIAGKLLVNSIEPLTANSEVTINRPYLLEQYC